MSRLAKKPAKLPNGVTVNVLDKAIEVKGPKGVLSLNLNEGIRVVLKEDTLIVEEADNLKHYPFLGLDTSRVNNALKGVSEGFTKTLELVGVGYRAALKGNILDLSLGFSHPCELSIPQGIEIKIEKNTVIHVSGIDKVLVGQFSATIRSKRPPEPYKGKGVKYAGEYIKRKIGKKTK